MKEKTMKNNSGIPSVSPATPEGIKAITETNRDYNEGWFTEIMTNATREGGGSALLEYEKKYEIVILNVFRHTATVKISSSPSMNYLHLARFKDRWQIVNVLYEVRCGEETVP